MVQRATGSDGEGGASECYVAVRVSRPEGARMRVSSLLGELQVERKQSRRGSCPTPKQGHTAAAKRGRYSATASTCDRCDQQLLGIPGRGRG
jgi:hypothetical protein